MLFKGSTAIISIGATIYQVNASKLLRPLDTVDLEELPDSCERTRALALWLSCEGQTDVWELFSGNSYLSAIFDRQGLLVAAPIDLGTKKAESFSRQLLQGFWSKVVVMSPTVTMKSFQQKEAVWQQYHVCLAVAEHLILGGKHFLLFWTRVRKYLVVEKGTVPSEKVPLQMDTPARQENKNIFHNLGNLLRRLYSRPK